MRFRPVASAVRLASPGRIRASPPQFGETCPRRHIVLDRGALVADIGAVFAALGALGHAALGIIYLIMRSLGGGDATAMRTFEERFNSDVPVGVVGLTLLLSFGIGIALLAWAAWRAGIIGVWGPAVITAVVVAHNVLPEDLPSVVPATALGLIAVVYGWFGVRTTRLSDAEWEAHSGAPNTIAGDRSKAPTHQS
jgi:hypothetical protein